MVKTQKFVKKPLYVDVVEVTAENFEEVASWCQGDMQDSEGSPYIRVRVHKPLNKRQTQAFVGDWILYTDMGYKVYTTKAFRANFDPVEEVNEYNPDQQTMTEIEKSVDGVLEGQS